VAEDVTPIRAAGGVLWRAAPSASGESGVEIAVIHRPRYDDWSFPKGKLSPNESDIEGAVREVLEETGYRVRVGRPLGEVRYLKNQGGVERPKVVRYWAMQADGGGFTPNREVDELRWVSPAEAKELLTHPHDEKVLERFIRGPVLSGCVLLVRHAKAGDRSSWTDDDRLRPLDENGQRQAEELVRPLSRFEVDEIYSADNLRCVQTVEPVAEAVGLKIQEDELFSEDGYPAHEDEAIHVVRNMGESLKTTVVCSQGDVIPDLLERLAAVDHVDLPEPFECKKASVFALTFDGPRLFSVEYFPPPPT
jgi:8-oxo-dGTP diphosphatase